MPKGFCTNLVFIMMIKFARFLSSAALIMALSACASINDTPNQEIYVQTPGAKGARCILSTQDFRAIAYPPKPVLMRRMADPLKVTCQAPGNREKTVVVRSHINPTATANALTAVVGVAYDSVSGALYEYPSPIIVDFRNVRAGPQEMPLYHSADTVSPFDQVNEDMQDRPAQTPQDQGLKTAIPKKESIISKEQPVSDRKTAPSDIERPY